MSSSFRSSILEDRTGVSRFCHLTIQTIGLVSLPTRLLLLYLPFAFLSLALFSNFISLLFIVSFFGIALSHQFCNSIVTFVLLCLHTLFILLFFPLLAFGATSISISQQVSIILLNIVFHLLFVLLLGLTTDAFVDSIPEFIPYVYRLLAMVSPLPLLAMALVYVSASSMWSESGASFICLFVYTMLLTIIIAPSLTEARIIDKQTVKVHIGILFICPMLVYSCQSSVLTNGIDLNILLLLLCQGLVCLTLLQPLWLGDSWDFFIVLFLKLLFIFMIAPMDPNLNPTDSRRFIAFCFGLMCFHPVDLEQSTIRRRDPLDTDIFDRIFTQFWLNHLATLSLCYGTALPLYMYPVAFWGVFEYHRLHSLPNSNWHYVRSYCSIVVAVTLFALYVSLNFFAIPWNSTSTSGVIADFALTALFVVHVVACGLVTSLSYFPSLSKSFACPILLAQSFVCVLLEVILFTSNSTYTIYPVFPLFLSSCLTLFSLFPFFSSSSSSSNLCRIFLMVIHLSKLWLLIDISSFTMSPVSFYIVFLLLLLSLSLLRKSTSTSSFRTRPAFLFGLVSTIIISFAQRAISYEEEIQTSIIITTCCCVVSGMMLLYSFLFSPLLPLPVLLALFSMAFAMEMFSHYVTYGVILVISFALFIYFTLLVAMAETVAPSLHISLGASYYYWHNLATLPRLFGVHVGLLLVLYFIPSVLPAMYAIYIPLSLYHSALAVAYSLSSLVLILGVRISSEMQKLHPKVLAYFGLKLLSTTEFTSLFMVHNLSLYLIYFLFSTLSILEFSTSFHTPLFLFPLLLLQSSTNIIQVYGMPCILLSLYYFCVAIYEIYNLATVFQIITNICFLLCLLPPWLIWFRFVLFNHHLPSSSFSSASGYWILLPLNFICCCWTDCSALRLLSIFNFLFGFGYAYYLFDRKKAVNQLI